MKKVEFWMPLYYSDSWHIEKSVTEYEDFGVTEFKSIKQLERYFKKIKRNVENGYYFIPDYIKVGHRYYTLVEYDMSGSSMSYASITDGTSMIEIYNTQRYSKAVEMPFKNAIIKETTEYAITEKDALNFLAQFDNQALIYTIR